MSIELLRLEPWQKAKARAGLPFLIGCRISKEGTSDSLERIQVNPK
jgi:hypothetical protein